MIWETYKDQLTAGKEGYKCVKCPSPEQHKIYLDMEGISKSVSQCGLTTEDAARAINLMSNNPTTLSETMERLDSSLRRIIEK